MSCESQISWFNDQELPITRQDEFESFHWSFLNIVFDFLYILETQSFVLNLWKFLAVSIAAEENSAKQVKKLCLIS